MNENVALVTGVCGDIGCSTVRSLYGKVKKIIGCDVKEHTPVANYLDAYFIAPPASNCEEYIAFMGDVVGKKDIDYIIPISEQEIELINERMNDIKRDGVHILINNNKIIGNFLDKLKTVEYLDSIGIRVPKTMPLEEYTGRYGYPLVIKSRRSCGSKNVIVVSNDGDLEYARKRNDGTLIAQECIGSEEEEYTTAVFSDGLSTSSITFRRKLGFGGLSVEAHLVNEPALECIAKMIADSVELIGSINIQSRRVGDAYVPFEINPRLSSTLSIRKHFGFDDAIWWMNALCGKKHVYKMKYQSGTAIRYLCEHFIDMKGEDEYR